MHGDSAPQILGVIGAARESTPADALFQPLGERQSGLATAEFAGNGAGYVADRDGRGLELQLTKAAEVIGAQEIGAPAEELAEGRKQAA